MFEVNQGERYVRISCMARKLWFSVAFENRNIYQQKMFPQSLYHPMNNTECEQDIIKYVQMTWLNFSIINIVQ